MKNILAVTTIAFLGLNFYIFGFKVIIVWLILYSLLATLDVTLWFLKAKINKKITSYRFLNWITSKITNIFYILWLAVWLGFLKHFNHENIFYIWLIPIIFIWFMMFGEFLSITENLRIINESAKTKESLFLKVVEKISKVLYFSWLEIVEKKSMKYIEKKKENFLNEYNENNKDKK